MKKLFFFATIIFFLISCQDDPQEIYMVPENLLVGFSFEADQDGFLFRPSRDGKFIYTHTFEDSFDGKGSLKMTSIGSEGDFGFWTYRLTDLEVGSDLTVVMRIKTEDITGLGVAFNMFARDDTGTTINDLISVSGVIPTIDREWSEFSFSMPGSMTEEVAHVDMYFLILENTQGTVFIDKVEILD